MKYRSGVKPREINLILEYGYVIEKEEAALEKYKDRKGYHKVYFDIAYVQSFLVSDLFYLSKKVSDPKLKDELERIYVL